MAILPSSHLTSLALASHFTPSRSLHSLSSTHSLPTPNSSPQNPISNLKLPCSQRSPDSGATLLGKFGNWKILNHILLTGLYQYRFIVDGCLMCDPDCPWVYDNSGSAYNILDLQECVSELPQHLAKFEPPPSPPSSYDNRLLSEDDFSKPPLEVPPQLQVAFLNKPSSSNNGDQPPMPGDACIANQRQL